MDRGRRGSIRPSHCKIERRLDRQWHPTHLRRHACHPAVPIQENRVQNLLSRDKSTTRNTLYCEGLTLKSTRSADEAGLALPAAPKLLWRPATAVAHTTSPSFQGRRLLPLPRFRSSPPSEAWGSLTMAVAEIASLGVTGNGRQENPLLRWDGLGGRDESKLIYSMLSVRLHVRCPSCGPCYSRGPGRSTLRGVGSWLKGDAEGRERRVQCARRALDLVSDSPASSRSQSEVGTRGSLFLLSLLSFFTVFVDVDCHVWVLFLQYLMLLFCLFF
jgi:hypothetical protein